MPRREPGERPLIVICGGGTGGHTSPGLAVAAVLKARGLRCAWIGSRDGVEARRVPAAGIEYVAISTGKLRRYWDRRNITDAVVNVPAGLAQAWTALGRLRPRVVFGTGGFVALPVVAAAVLRRIPSVVHEQTVVPGLANRLSAPLARKIAVTYARSASHFPAGKVAVTGNPLRAELRTGSAAAAIARYGFAPALPVVYVTGGAQGAHRINRAVGGALPALLQQGQVVHQCGDNATTGDRAWLQEQRAALPAEHQARYVISPFIGDELANLYAAAALVVGRSGAGTLNECCHLGVAALYIPLPGTSGDEQTQNARMVSDAGGAEILPQDTLTPAALAERVNALLATPHRLQEMGERARAFAVPDAAERIADLLETVARA
jgi:UDP-N-acetylglucosamine--N-acetylmuramyl-(pentapeptide) pyrophosphoryl-undecaprenol N-acetylglucosamine transferase